MRTQNQRIPEQTIKVFSLSLACSAHPEPHHVPVKEPDDLGLVFWSRDRRATVCELK